MASVHAAIDRATGRRVALKRLHAERMAASHRRNQEAFEREYHALAQLAHPHVVEVYEFDTDAQGAYYTMELLDGGDIHQLGRVPWRRACEIARDVCSALALVHSRRLVHRDVSPRNVRCTSDGRAKLIDFGAIAPVGPSKVLVGTPPCCAPESLQCQVLDGRTDLYGLGATLYFMLVGQHAYPARHVATLHEAWLAGFSRPSDSVPDIPPALDELVLDLLRLQPDARPASAAEVMQRLSGIDGTPLGDELQIAQHHLSTPTLVGRQDQLARAGRRLRRAAAGAVRSVLVEGNAGVGRSRFLDACLLDATLLGSAVLRADADDAVRGEYGVVRALAQRLTVLFPQTAVEMAQSALSVLLQLLPELGGPAPEAATDPPLTASRAAIQRAFSDWVVALSHRRPLVIGVDDVHRIDEPSAAWLTLLAAEAGDHPICIIATAERGHPWLSSTAGRLMIDSSTHVPLEPLAPEQTAELLGSLFGDTPNLALLSQRANALCAGNPRDLIRFAQHLLDRGVVRYQAGAFSLPAQFESTDLPESLAGALQARVLALGATARELAYALCLCPDQRFSLAECACLIGAERSSAHTSWGALGAIDELVRADVLRTVNEGIGLAQESQAAVLRSLVPAALTPALHARLAQVFQERETSQFLAARHLLWSGQEERALDTLLEYCRTLIPPAFVATRQTEAFGRREVYERALELCALWKRPRAQHFLLLQRTVTLDGWFGIHDTDLLTQMLDQLRHDSGLLDWHAQDASVAPKERLQRAIEMAKARYASTPEHERVLAPADAIRELATALFVSLGVVAPALDLTYLDAIPDLEPMLPLSAAITTVVKLAEAMRARLQGKLDVALSLYAEVLARVQQPDLGGMSALQGRRIEFNLMNLQGLIHAANGQPRCLELAERLAQEPIYTLNATNIRMLYALFQGDIKRALAAHKEAEQLRLQESQEELHEGLHLLWTTEAHVISEDLTHLRQALDAIAPRAQRYPAWRAVAHWTSAEYHRIRHAYAEALSEIQRALAAAPPGRHQAWQAIACSHLSILHGMQRQPEALARAQEYVQTAEQVLGQASGRLQLARAQIHGAARHPQAAAMADAVLMRFAADGVGGIQLGLAHEVRARVAIWLGDDKASTRHAEACASIYTAHGHPALAAKYERLRHQATQAKNQGQKGGRRTNPDSGARLSSALERCASAEQRAKVLLTVLTVESRARGGYLFGFKNGELCLFAKVGDIETTGELLEDVEQYLGKCREAAETTHTETGPIDENAASALLRDVGGRRCQPWLLSHDDERGQAISGVVVLVQADTPLRAPTRSLSDVSRTWAPFGDTDLLRLGGA